MSSERFRVGGGTGLDIRHCNRFLIKPNRSLWSSNHPSRTLRRVSVRSPAENFEPSAQGSQTVRRRRAPQYEVDSLCMYSIGRMLSEPVTNMRSRPFDALAISETPFPTGCAGARRTRARGRYPAARPPRRARCRRRAATNLRPSRRMRARKEGDRTSARSSCRPRTGLGAGCRAGRSGPR
jgi:hypothetical protein